MTKAAKAKIANLPSGVGVTRIVVAGCQYWRVRLGKRFTGGAVVKKNFKVLGDAREWIFGDAKKEKATAGAVVDLQRSAGAAAFALTPAQLNEAAAAFKRLDGQSLTKAVDYFLRHANPEGGQKKITEVIEEFLKSRKAMGVKDRTYTQYESYLKTIREKFGASAANTLKRAEIEDWIGESTWAKRTRNNYVSTLSTLLLFAKGRGYCIENVAESVPRAILDDAPPGILTVEQVKALLKRAEEEMPQMIPYIAICVFAGLRRSEACALEWSEVDLEAGHLEVTAGKAKTRQRRIVDISPNLKAWLVKYKPQQREGEVITKSVPVEGETSAEEKAKVPMVAPSKNEDVTGEMLRKLVEEKKDDAGRVIRPAIVTPWPHNALRHCFGSYHFAQYGDENKTAAQMGNSPAVIFRHYRAVVKPAVAVEFWGIEPSRSQKKSKGSKKTES